jgi:hypothetical protein
MTYFNHPTKGTYIFGGEAQPRKLVSKFEGRKVGAMRGTIPPRTIEPPQVHLEHFEELLTDFDKAYVVIFYDIKTNKFRWHKYEPGEDIVIGPLQPHWLTNIHSKPLSFTCEYSPHPWNENDEPEFINLSTLMKFLDGKGLLEKLC